MNANATYVLDSPVTRQFVRSDGEVVTLSFEAGIITPETDDERDALEHLVSVNLATRRSGAEKE